jgi:hypothetical protein
LGGQVEHLLLLVTLWLLVEVVVVLTKALAVVQVVTKQAH